MMSEPAKVAPKRVSQRMFKYPSEDEIFVRRIGAGVLACWTELPPEFREKILTEAASAWDREYNVRQLSQKLEEFVKRYPSRVS
jgi:hypothetical protein